MSARQWAKPGHKIHVMTDTHYYVYQLALKKQPVPGEVYRLIGLALTLHEE